MKSESIIIEDNNYSLNSDEENQENLSSHHLVSPHVIFVDNNFEPITPDGQSTLIEQNRSISRATTETISTSDDTSTSSGAFQEKSTGVQHSSLSPFDIERFLKNDILGEGILVKGINVGLNNSDRDKLSELLIKHLVNQHGKLTQEDFLILANKINNIFPKEHVSTYYVAPIYKTMSSKNVHEKARGKLVDKQRNLLYMVKKLKNDKTDEVIEEKESNHQGKHNYFINKNYFINI